MQKRMDFMALSCSKWSRLPSFSLLEASFWRFGTAMRSCPLALPVSFHSAVRLAWLERLLELVPGHLEGLELLGRLLEHRGRLTEALEAYRRLRSLAPARCRPFEALLEHQAVHVVPLEVWGELEDLPAEATQLPGWQENVYRPEEVPAARQEALEAGLAAWDEVFREDVVRRGEHLDRLKLEVG